MFDLLLLSKGMLDRKREEHVALQEELRSILDSDDSVPGTKVRDLLEREWRIGQELMSDNNAFGFAVMGAVRDGSLTVDQMLQLGVDESVAADWHEREKVEREWRLTHHPDGRPRKRPGRPKGSRNRASA